MPVQRKPVDEYHRLTGSVVFVIDIDGARVFFTNRDVLNSAKF
jgi:hypothetical protein